MDFGKLSSGAELPIASGVNVFLRSEYQAHIGTQHYQALVRLNRLAAEGKVRRVRTKRNGRLVQAWEYIAKSSKKVKNSPNEQRAG
jgi:hypothetical protein